MLFDPHGHTSCIPHRSIKCRANTLQCVASFMAGCVCSSYDKPCSEHGLERAVTTIMSMLHRQWPRRGDENTRRFEVRFGENLDRHLLNGCPAWWVYVVLQGNVHFRTAEFKHFVELPAGKRLGTPLGQVPV